MDAAPVFAIRDVELGVTDLERTSAFYAGAWGLVCLAADGDGHVFRAAGLEHHVLVLQARTQACLISAGFAVQQASDVDKLYQHLRANGQTVLHGPHEQPARLGGGYGLDVLTPQGMRVRVSADVATHHTVLGDLSLPQKLSHLVVNSTDRAALASWFIEQLGFKLSDTTRTQIFLRCGSDHHSLALGEAQTLSVNHVAYEMAGIDGVMYGTGRMMDHGHVSEWGLGRHGPGSNVFNYFIDPEGFAIEYTAELDQVTDVNHEPGTPEYWTTYPRRPCRWGVARRPSERLMRAFGGQHAAVALSVKATSNE